MRLTFFGHAAFLVETAGRRIILDPFRSPDSGGYAPIHEHADAVVVSHENDRYHSHLGQISPPFEVVRGMEIPLGGAMAGGIRFESIPVFETPEKLAGDEVSIVHFRSEGIHVVFLGDLGHRLTSDELAPILGADVVLAPTGGPPTIALEELREVLIAVAPRIVIPMHFWTPRINLRISPPEPFLGLMNDWEIERPGTSEYEVEVRELPGRPRIVQLEPAR